MRKVDLEERYPIPDRKTEKIRYYYSVLYDEWYPPHRGDNDKRKLKTERDWKFEKVRFQWGKKIKDIDSDTMDWIKHFIRKNENGLDFADFSFIFGRKLGDYAHELQREGIPIREVIIRVLKRGRYKVAKYTVDKIKNMRVETWF